MLIKKQTNDQSMYLVTILVNDVVIRGYRLYLRL